MVLVVVCRAAVAAGPSLTIEPETNAATPATYTVSWPTEAGMRYELLESANLIEPWKAVPGFPLDGSGLPMQVGVTAPATSQFFRVAAASGPGEQQLNVPLPADGTRYDAYADFDGPSWPGRYGEGHVTLWHNDKFAAYSVTIDDNNAPDFPFWMAAAETYGWTFTWFVIVHPYVWDIDTNQPGSNTGYFGTLAQFASLAALGHDIQLHGACGVMNALTAAAYESHVTRSVAVLEGATGQPVITFAYPCGQMVSDDGQHDYHEVISRHMIAARGTSGGVTPVHLLDYLNTHSLGANALVDGAPSATFARVRDGTRSFLYSQYRGWCVTLYHGLDATGEASALATLDYVKAHEDEFWVAPFTAVAKYAQERETATLRFVTIGTDRIVFRVGDAMDDAVFDHPLTVKVRLDAGWTGLSAAQDALPIPSRLVVHNGVPYALVQPRPDRGLVFLSKPAP